MASIPFADDDDKPREECGVFALFDQDEAAAHTVLGLHALQHRGQEAAGIVSFDGHHFHSHRATGLIGDSFSRKSVVDQLGGRSAIGHTRYATTGESMLRNVQPLYADFVFGGLAIAHNGNLTNARVLRRELVHRGCIFQSTTDTEVIVHLIARSHKTSIIDRIVDALGQVEGAYSLVALMDDAIVGARDPLGVRPLVLGRLGDTHILASESCALDIIGAETVRELEPGEVVVVDRDGLRSLHPFREQAQRFCIFEYV
ncbi:MAG: class II glutamine amidotransferase, partial [Geminicoccaceae bacterium]|nr:class II glutamine amidotransferase [Geminicoccaceae bacterium]